MDTSRLIAFLFLLVLISGRAVADQTIQTKVISWDGVRVSAGLLILWETAESEGFKAQIKIESCDWS
jgi:hypothetical protein